MKITRLDLRTLRMKVTEVEAQVNRGEVYDAIDALTAVVSCASALRGILRNESRAGECGEQGPTTGERCALPANHVTVWHRTPGRSECWPATLCGVPLGSKALRVSAEEVCPCTLAKGHDGAHQYDQLRHLSAVGQAKLAKTA